MLPAVTLLGLLGFAPRALVRPVTRLQPAQRLSIPFSSVADDTDGDQQQRRIAELQAELERLRKEERELLGGAGGEMDLDALELMDDEIIEDEVDEGDDGGQSKALRVDAALAELARSGSREAAAAAGGFGEVDEPAAEPPSPELESGSVIAIAGGATPLGRSLTEAIARSGRGWRVRVLASDADASGVSELEGVETAAASPASALSSALADISALVVVSASAGGAAGVPDAEVRNLMGALPTDEGVRRLVFVSTHGVERTDRLPFSMANAFGGALDKLRAAEQEVQLRAMARVPSFSVVRLGKLSAGGGGGGGGGGERCELAVGDALQGEVSVNAASSVLYETLCRPEAVNATFSAGPLPRSGPGWAGVAADGAVEEHWDDEFVKLVGPELYRRRLSRRAADEVAEWLRGWGRGFLEPGSGLTTPVEVVEVEGGVLLRFVVGGGAAAARYRSFDEPDETADDKWAAAAAAAKEKRDGGKRGSPDGALLVVAEASPCARVRVSRAEMGAETIVKEMSEETILERLRKGLDALDR